MVATQYFLLSPLQVVAVVVLTAIPMELLALQAVQVVAVEQAVVAVALLVVRLRHLVRVTLAALVVLVLAHHIVVAVEVVLTQPERQHLLQEMVEQELLIALAVHL
jgi:hypothetical protein